MTDLDQDAETVRGALPNDERWCEPNAALDRILARMDETVIEHQRARITELVIEQSNIANELKAYPDSDLVSLAKTYETARVAAEARITELEAEVERLREELKQEQVWFRDAARARNDLERDYAHLYDRLRGIEEAARELLDSSPNWDWRQEELAVALRAALEA